MIWLFSLLLSMANAGYLQIVGESDLHLYKHARGLLIAGEYRLQNHGDEIAREVFPEISIDQYRWHGEPHLLQAGETATWKISELIPASQLVLPNTGRFPMVIYHHYQDLNAYPFAVPKVELTTIKEKEMGERPTVKMKIEPLGATEFTAHLQIANPTAEILKMLPIYFLPKEMELISAEVPLEVPAGQEMAVSFQFANRKGLPGSSYQAFAVLQWIEKGQRQATFGADVFRIEKNQKGSRAWGLDAQFVAWLLWSLALGLIGMWAFWIRPLRKFPRK